MAKKKNTGRNTKVLKVSPQTVHHNTGGIPLSDFFSNSLTYNRSAFDLAGNFNKSLKGRNSADADPDPQTLSQTLLFTRAIERISDGVAQMPWIIDSVSKESSEADIEYSKKLTRALNRPNREEGDTYRKFIKTIVKDLLVFNIACVERQGGSEKDQLFWLWNTCPKDIHLNPEWSPHVSGLSPKFYYVDPYRRDLLSEEKIPLKDEDMFIVQARTSSWELVPLSPVMIAYKHINTWLKLSHGQDVIVENPIRNHLVSLTEGNEAQVAAFRQYWQTHILGRSEPPIIQGKVEVQKLAAETDSELFLQFTEYIISMIALSFSLSKRDFNLTEHDNRATSEASANSSFQEAILPIGSAILEAINYNVVEYYTEGKYEINIGELEARKKQEEASIAQMLYNANLATKNEMRKRLGLDPVEGGDAFSNEQGMGGAMGMEDGAIGPDGMPIEGEIGGETGGMVAEKGLFPDMEMPPAKSAGAALFPSFNFPEAKSAGAALFPEITKPEVEVSPNLIFAQAHRRKNKKSKNSKDKYTQLSLPI